MRMSAWLMAACVAVMAPEAAFATTWTLYKADCEGGVAAAEIACGAYGRYLIDPEVAPDCPVVASGAEEAMLYPPPHQGAIAFPIQARRLHEAPSPLTALTKAIPFPSPMPPWIAVLDFLGIHGNSTAYLAQHVGGITAWLVPLDRLEREQLFPGCSPFSDTWMSALDNQRSKAVLGVTYTPLSIYLPQLVRYYLDTDPPPPAGYARRARELELARETI